MTLSTEEKILSIAKSHFVKKGYAGTRLQEIADEAQINKALLHYYFRTKEQLYSKVAEQTVDLVLTHIASAIKSDGSFRDRLDTLVSAYIEILSKHPEIPTFLMSELSQRSDQLVTHIKSKGKELPDMQSFVAQMMSEMENKSIKTFAPLQFMLSILGMTIFPFMAKPVFQTVFDFSEQSFTDLIAERKTHILSLIDHAIRI